MKRTPARNSLPHHPLHPGPRNFRADRWGALCLLVASVVMIAGGAVHADERAAVARVADINKQALSAYESLELEDARNLLTQALQICASEGLAAHPIRARTHLHLGVILAGGFQDRERAVVQFKKALELQRDITLTASLSNPEIDAYFKEAQMATTAVEPPVVPVEVEEVEEEDPEGGPPRDITGIFHEPVASAPQGERIEIRAAVEPKLETQRLVLAYRPAGASGFLIRSLVKDELGWWIARIPAPATEGALVHYYIEARDNAGRAVANNGSPDEAHVIALGAGVPGVDASVLVSDDELPAALRTPAHKRWMFGILIGSGYGMARGTPELTPFPSDDPGAEINFSGRAPSGTFVLSPEVGYFLSSRLLLSAQVRIQLLTGLTQAKDVRDGREDRLLSPAGQAFAGFVKGTYFFSDSNFKPFVSAAIGAGGIRHVIDIGVFNSTCGDNPEPGELGDQACIDSVLSGPFFLGPGAGVAYDFGSGLGVFAGVNSLIGMPNFSFNLDFGLGLMLAL